MAIWDKISHRGRVEDRRGLGGIVGGGVGTIVLMMGIVYLMGGNPLDVLVQADPSQLRFGPSEDAAQFEGADAYEEFAATVLGSADAYWREQFRTMNRTYTEPTLVLFRGRTSSSCGGANALAGPHYCPLDDTIYLDETFFEELQNRFGAEGGDVAEAYVIAHEVGHHVQNRLDLLKNSQTSNEHSIALELQADCFAGLWASSIKDAGVFEPNEIKEAIDAAAAVGDDRIQSRTSGTIQPESWTHGSSDQRVKAFTTGYETGSFAACGG